MGVLPRPDLPPGPHRDLIDALHALHHHSGWPSLRALAREAGCSPTTVSAVFSSPRLPSWGLVEAPEYYRGPSQFTPENGGDIRNVYVGGTFEGYTQVLVGIDGDPAPFRVFALTAPSRLVIDVADGNAE